MVLAIGICIKDSPGTSIIKPRQITLVQVISNVPSDFWLPDAVSWAVMSYQPKLVKQKRRPQSLDVPLSWGSTHLSSGLLEGSQMELNLSWYQAWIGQINLPVFVALLC